ncbi:GNAT family N-acetyltransferase [Pseudomonadota bacterium]|nr:GNAT family N-acetyltransferase [Pseudomonadota bacterium]
MELRWKSYALLTKKELYAIMHLRQQVFVLEQNCPFIDADLNDEISDHLLGYQDDELIAYARLVQPDSLYPGPSIGRIVTAEKVRGMGFGKIITQAAIDFSSKKYPNQDITISAQHRLLNFYKDLNFKAEGEVYLDDDIDHIKMTINPIKQSSFFSFMPSLTPNLVLILGMMIAIAVIGSSFLKKIDLDQLNWIAKIDDRAISKSKYESYLDSVAQSRKSGLIASDAENILERMIDEELLIQRAVDLGMLENDSELRSIIIQKMISSIIADTKNVRFSQEDLQTFFLSNQDFFAPSPKLHLLKLSFAESNSAQANKAREMLLAGNLASAKQLADSDVIQLPNTLLPSTKIREYIGPLLTQEALKLSDNEVSQIIVSENQLHLLVVIKKLRESAGSFEEMYEEIESEYIRQQGEQMLDEYLMDLRNWYDVVKANDL